jgi:hypothetical protein
MSEFENFLLCERILDNLSKRNVKLILMILSDLEPLKDSSFVCKLGFFGMSGPVSITSVLKAHELVK